MRFEDFDIKVHIKLQCKECEHNCCVFYDRISSEELLEFKCPYDKDDCCFKFNYMSVIE